MNTKVTITTTSLLCWTILVICITDYANAEKSCKEVTADVTKKQLAQMGPCTKELNFKNGKEKAQRMMCILKCAMIKLDFLDPDGKMTDASIDKFSDREFPESMRKQAKEVLKVCMNQAGPGLDPSEFNCKSYDPLIKCLMEHQKDSC